MAVAFTVCLIISNLFATKVFTLGWGINLPGSVIIFPISYILNDCFTEVWGYRKARLVIWTAFAANFAAVLLGQIVV
ncbi:MAG: VUT family protein, partial [Bacteroidales bacterium]|nr:VUT family protein [Bacteroidales bacterium]